MEYRDSDILIKTIERAKKGKSKALLSLYNQYCDAMFNICMRMCANREDAEDVLQEAFTSAFAKLDKYEFKATFGAWLKKIVINKCLSALRKNNDNSFIQMDENSEVVEDSGNVNYEDVEFKVKQVNDAIMKLPEGYRVIATLYLLEGYDHREIADIMSIKESTSKSQLLRAKRKIKEILQYHD